MNGIARFVAGRYWRKATRCRPRRVPGELFRRRDREHLGRSDFSQYSGQKFEVRKGGHRRDSSQICRENVALVESLFFTIPTSPVRIEWRVASKGDLFKIVDVKLEGISMATTQRDEFNSVVSKSGRDLASLIDELRRRRDS